MDLTTAATVKAIMSHGGTGDDTLIATLITGVSGRVETALARHVQASSRTETFQLDPGGRLVVLPGFPVTTLGDIKMSDDGTFSEDALVEGEGFRANLRLGTVLLLDTNSYDRAELRVTYTGGMAADTASFVTAFPGLSYAVAMQVVNEFQRRRAPGGSATIAGAGVAYEKGIDNLPMLEEEIQAHRRIY